MLPQCFPSVLLAGQQLKVRRVGAWRFTLLAVTRPLPRRCLSTRPTRPAGPSLTTCRPFLLGPTLSGEVGARQAGRHAGRLPAPACGPQTRLAVCGRPGDDQPAHCGLNPLPTSRQYHRLCWHALPTALVCTSSHTALKFLSRALPSARWAKCAAAATVPPAALAPPLPLGRWNANRDETGRWTYAGWQRAVAQVRAAQLSPSAAMLRDVPAACEHGWRVPRSGHSCGGMWVQLGRPLWIYALSNANLSRVRVGDVQLISESCNAAVLQLEAGMLCVA